MSKFLQLAVNKARETQKTKNRQRHYCIITDRKGNIVSEASNSYVKTEPGFKELSELLGFEGKELRHAEYGAIKKDRKKRGYSLYVARIGANNEPLPSCPCAVCMMAIRKADHIKQIFYT